MLESQVARCALPQETRSVIALVLVSASIMAEAVALVLEPWQQTDTVDEKVGTSQYCSCEQQRSWMT